MARGSLTTGTTRECEPSGPPGVHEKAPASGGRGRGFCADATSVLLVEGPEPARVAQQHHTKGNGNREPERHACNREDGIDNDQCRRTDHGYSKRDPSPCENGKQHQRIAARAPDRLRRRHQGHRVSSGLSLRVVFIGKGRAGLARYVQMLVRERIARATSRTGKLRPGSPLEKASAIPTLHGRVL